MQTRKGYGAAQFNTELVIFLHIAWDSLIINEYACKDYDRSLYSLPCRSYS